MSQGEPNFLSMEDATCVRGRNRDAFNPLIAGIMSSEVLHFSDHVWPPE